MVERAAIFNKAVGSDCCTAADRNIPMNGCVLADGAIGLYHGRLRGIQGHARKHEFPVVPVLQGGMGLSQFNAGINA